MDPAADGDEEHREQNRGYRDGYLGVVDLQDPANGIQILRKWRDWSVDQLAAMVGVSPDRVKDWEVGHMPSEEEMRVLEKLRSE